MVYKSVALISKGKKMACLVMSVNFLLTFILGFTFENCIITSPNRNISTQIDNYQPLYQLSDNDADVDKYFNDIICLNNLKNFYNSISESEIYGYYEFKEQPILIKEIENIIDINNNFFNPYKIDRQLTRYNGEFYENNYDVEGEKYLDALNIFLDYKYFNLMKLQIVSGRPFTKDDMEINSFEQIIPVILGFNYMSTMKLGDVFFCNYLGQELKMEIIGFLEQNSTVVSSGRIKDLDNYIVSPFINMKFTPKTYDEMFIQGAIYIDKVNGYLSLKSNHNIEEAFRYIEMCKLSNGISFDLLPVSSKDYFKIELIKALVDTNFEESVLLIFSLILIKIYLIFSLEEYIFAQNNALFKIL